MTLDTEGQLPITTVGIIGAGEVGSQLARVVIANGFTETTGVSTGFPVALMSFLTRLSVIGPLGLSAWVVPMVKRRWVRFEREWRRLRAQVAPPEPAVSERDRLGDLRDRAAGTTPAMRVPALLRRLL